MNGICISKGDDLSREFGFSVIFQPIEKYLANYYWVCYGYQSSPLVNLIYEKGGYQILKDLLYLGETKGYSVEILKPESISKYSGYLCNDWITMVGVRSVDDKVLEFYKFKSQTTKPTSQVYKYIEIIADLCFFNVDGHSWEIYTKHENLLKIQKEFYKDDPSVLLRDSTLLEKEKVLWDNWGPGEEGK